MKPSDQGIVRCKITEKPVCTKQKQITNTGQIYMNAQKLIPKQLHQKKPPNHEKSHSENPTLDNYIPLAKVNGI